MTLSMSLAILTPLLPLLTTMIVLIGESDTQDQRMKLGVLPLTAAFVGSFMMLILVVSEGPISLRFYDPLSVANLALPLGFRIDRLSAVMMVLISTVGA